MTPDGKSRSEPSAQSSQRRPSLARSQRWRPWQTNPQPPWLPRSRGNLLRDRSCRLTSNKLGINKNAGRDYDKDAFKRAKDKITTREKYEGERNKQKRDNNNRKGGRNR